MDGIHDLGGLQGFGPIDVHEPEEPFHEPWEGRVRGIVEAISRPSDWNGHWFRHCRELIDPVDYLTRPYFDQWLQTYAAMMVNSGVATVEELASGHARTPPPGLPPPMTAGDVGKKKAIGGSGHESGQPSIFTLGDSVRTKGYGVFGHTRLPAYARGRCGWIEAYHGAHILPDAIAHGEDRVEPLYTVGFDAAELWPEAEGRRERIFLDLWESYLERS